LKHKTEARKTKGVGMRIIPCKWSAALTFQIFSHSQWDKSRWSSDSMFLCLPWWTSVLVAQPEQDALLVISSWITYCLLRIYVFHANNSVVFNAFLIFLW